MTAQEFGRHTPRELDDMVTGARVNLEAHRELFGWLAQRIGHWEHPPTLEQVMGRELMELDVRHAAEPEPERNEKADATMAKIELAKARAAAKASGAHEPGEPTA